MSEATANAADAALAVALGDIPAPTSTPAAGLVDTKASFDGDIEPCTREEAETLVTRARASLVTLSDTMMEIIRRRAWEALDYESPQQFWVKEFGPNSPGTQGFSRQHVYRTARVVGLLYELFERLGDDAEAIDITERTLRAIPRGADGVNDLQLVDEIAAGVEALGDDYSHEDVQRVVDDKVKAARDRFKTPVDDGPAADPQALAERMRRMGMDPSGFLAVHEQPDTDDDGDAYDDESPAPERATPDLAAMLSGPVDHTPAVDDTPTVDTQAAHQAAGLAAAFNTVLDATKALPDLIDRFTGPERDLIPAWVAALRDCADRLETYDDEDDLIEYDPNTV